VAKYHEPRYVLSVDVDTFVAVYDVTPDRQLLQVCLTKPSMTTSIRATTSHLVQYSWQTSGASYTTRKSTPNQTRSTPTDSSAKPVQETAVP